MTQHTTTLPGARESRLPSWKRWLSLQGYGLFTSSMFRARTAPLRMRARFERWAAVSREATQRKFPHVVFEDHTIGKLAMESVRAVPHARCTVLHLHGGAFVMGSPASYRNRAMRLSFRFDAEVFVPQYRLAPEHRYPAALDDALIAFQYVRALRRDVPLFVTGDSAGGALALGVLLRLRALGQPMPEGAILLSPWTDLTMSGASIDGNHGRDLWLTRAHLERWSAYYAGDADRSDPMLSPALADLTDLPPLLLLVGEHEILLDDSLRVAAAAKRAGTSAHVLVGAGMQHDWPLTLPWLDESRHAWREMRRFIDNHTRRQTMHIEPVTTTTQPNDNAYRRIVAASKKARFDLDRDVFRGRTLEPDLKYLPDGLSRIGREVALSEAERAFISRIQGRTYANIFGLVERYINAKVLELSQHHALGDQVALEALMRFSEEELKHQEMFRRLEAAAARVMPAGYTVAADPDAVARVVLGKSTWAVLALTCHIELFTLVHYKQSIDGDPQLSPLFRDVFLHHFKEESQHAVLDELEWRLEDTRVSDSERASAVTDLIELVVAVDGILQAQAHADCGYFVQHAGRAFSAPEQTQLEAMFLSAYRYQYIVSGIQQTRFVEVLTELLPAEEWSRVQSALLPLLSA